MDIFEKFLHEYNRHILSLDVLVQKFVLRSFIWLGLTWVLLLIPRRQGTRSIPLQWGMALLPPFISFSLPIDELLYIRESYFTLLFTLCCFANLILPAAIAKMLAPNLGAQRKIMVVLYLVLTILLVLQIFHLY